MKKLMMAIGFAISLAPTLAQAANVSCFLVYTYPSGKGVLSLPRIPLLPSGVENFYSASYGQFQATAHIIESDNSVGLSLTDTLRGIDTSIMTPIEMSTSQGKIEPRLSIHDLKGSKFADLVCETAEQTPQ